MKVLFLDIDGPMIPRRAYRLPGQTLRVTLFDPVAVSLLLDVLNRSKAKLVISSTWGSWYSKDDFIKQLEKNGISASYLHEDWVTPRKFSSLRCNEIQWWLNKHKEVTHYAILDDEHVPLPNTVRVTLNDGLLYGHYQKLLKLLDAAEEIVE